MTSVRQLHTLTTRWPKYRITAMTFRTVEMKIHVQGCGAAYIYVHCGVVSKGLLTFLGSLYKEGAKTTFGTLVYRFERQTARKKVFLPSKNTVSSTLNVWFYLRKLQIASFCILMSYFVESKLKEIPIDCWWRRITVKIGFPDFSRLYA